MAQWKKVFPWRVRLLVAAVALTACLLTVHNFSTLAPVDWPQLVAILVFGSLAAASHFRPTWSINQQAIYSTVPAAYFGLAMVLPQTWLAPVIVFSWLPWIVRRIRTRPTRPVEVTFNVSLDIVAAVAARDTFEAMDRLIPFPTLSLLVAALVFMAMQTMLVTAAVVFYRRIRLREVDSLKVSFLSAELTTVIVGGITVMLYQADPMSLLVLFLPLGFLQHLMERVQSEKDAYVDSKTGLLNYKYLDERLPKEVERARATGLPLSVVFSDLDFLREINNNYGHLAGDMAIQHVGSALKQCVEEHCFVARFGGEEYVLVLPQTDHDEALQVAETARARVAESPLAVGDVQFRVTMSFGVATFPEDGQSVRDLIHAADTAVYEAKAGGRNCVRSARRGVSDSCVASR